MNMHTFRLKEIHRTAAMNWTPVEAPIAEDTEETTTRDSKPKPEQQLKIRLYRVGTRGASALMFLVLGATGLWVVVDLAKIVVSSFKDK
jgi:hypothetical protein